MLKIVLISIAIILLITLIFVLPLLLKLKASYSLSFLERNEEDNLILNERQLEAFNGVKISDASKGDNKIITFSAKEETKYTYITLYYRQKKKTIIKHYRLNFKKQSEISIVIKGGFNNINFFVNQLNEEVYKEKVVQTISKKRIVLFTLLEYFTFIAFMICFMLYFMFSYKTLEINMLYGILFIVICVLIALASYPIFYLSTKWCFERYINGGFVNERN